MTRFRVLFALAIWGSVVGACSTPATSAGGSETNWVACADGGVCASGYTCDYTNRCLPAGNTGAVQSGSTSEALTAGTYTTFSDFIDTQPNGEGRDAATPRCLPGALPVLPDGTASCTMFDASPNSESQSCSGPGLAMPPGEDIPFVRNELVNRGRCDTASTPACDSLYFCKVQQLTGGLGEACRAGDPSSLIGGWCYVDPGEGLGDPALVAECPPAQKRLLRWPGPNEPGHVTFIECSGESPRRPDSPGEGSVGAPCTPLDESKADFGGFDEDGVSIELGAPECASSVCLVNNFRGRVSCPYGQTSEIDGGVPPSDQRCETTGSPSAPVTVPVEAQLALRRPDTAVYCSCRCGGYDPNAPYCTCPSGFECTDLVDLWASGIDAAYGEYCVKSSTTVGDPGNLAGESCTAEAQNCGGTNGGQ